MSDEVATALIAECRRRLFDESLPRLERCLSLLSDDEIWWRPNPESNSIGNLVLHLCGNVGQWIVSALGGAPDTRVRTAEFQATGPLPRAELLARLGDTMARASAVLDRLDPATLLDRRRVQAFEETGLSILVHVVEHFSYHVGQVSWAVKASKAVDLGWYRGVDLGRTSTGGAP